MADQSPLHTAFLTVDEAAARLGMSRLRVREAVARGVLAARRDNEGRLRVDLPDSGKLVAETQAELAPDAVLGFLFDDIEELEAALAERDGQIAQMADLLARQDVALASAGQALDGAERQNQTLAGMLDRALTHLEQTGGQDVQLHGMLARALGHLESGAEREDRLTAVSDRALQALEIALGKAEAREAQALRMADLLDRAMELAEKGHGSRDIADRAMGLLEDAMSRAEAAQSSAARAEANARITRAELDTTAAALTHRERDLEKSLALSERAAAAAEAATGTAASPSGTARKGFWRRLLGM